MTDENQTPTMLQVDSKTFLELYEALHELTDTAQWIRQRGDSAAADKLWPTIKRIADLLMAIGEGFDPDISKVNDAIADFWDKVQERIDQADTPEQIQQILKAADEMGNDILQRLNKAVAEAERQEKKKRVQ